MRRSSSGTTATSALPGPSPERPHPPAPEAGQREIERVPEEMDGARLAAVPAGEFLQDAVRPFERPPELPDDVAVVARVLLVSRERRVDHQAERHLPDRDVDLQPPEQRVQRRIELG